VFVTPPAVSGDQRRARDVIATRPGRENSPPAVKADPVAGERLDSEEDIAAAEGNRIV
jgi:hypothetical protein